MGKREMNKKLFLTSILAMGIILPTVALGGGGAVPEAGGLAPGGSDRPTPEIPEPQPDPEPTRLCEYRGFDGYYVPLTYSPGVYADDCVFFTCSVGHYCPGSGVAMSGSVSNLESCPSNYDNTATGLTSIEECCLDGYNSSTGLCNEGVFPSNGLMQENKTYFNAATSTNMDGVYSGNVNAVAEYDFINYVLNAGQYLPADSETPTTCPAGSYCSGIGNVNYNQNSAQGITSCPTIGGADFTSVAGSSAVTSCYQDTTMSTATLNPFTTEHLDTSINGNGYINGVKYKSATTTARRYATSATAAGEWAALDESDLAITDLACVNGYHYKAGTTGPNLTSLIGITEGGEGEGYKSNNGTGDNKNVDKYGITQNGEFVVDYGSKGKIHGHAQCSTQSGTGIWNGASDPSDVTTSATLPDSSGKYCYCQLDSYTPVSGSVGALSAPWVFSLAFGSVSNCADRCALGCAAYMRYSDSDHRAFRAAVLGSVLDIPASCAANTITINWKDVDTATAGQNDEGTATYGGDVRTPFKAETKPGKRFLGWIFSKPEQTNLPE